MRIALYHNHLAGGAAKVTEEWLKRYGEKHHVEIFTPDTSDTGFVDLDRYAKEVHRFPIPGGETVGGRYRRVQAVPRYGRDIAAEIDAGKFDVVFANLSYITQAPEILPSLHTPSLYYAPESHRVLYEKFPFGKPYDPKAVTKRGVLAGYDWMRKRQDRKNIRSATRVFTHSNYTRDTLRDIYGVQADVIYLGVDADLFRPGKSKRGDFVLSVGAMHPGKGHQFVIESLATLPAEKRPKLVVVGPRGEDFAKVLRRYARKLGVKLETKHGVKPAELVQLYGRAGVMAAGQFREPFGLMTLEAMATETPVVAVDEGGLCETVTDGKTGLILPRQPELFGAALRKVLDDPKLAARLGKAGRADVVKRWRWEDTAAKIDALLAETARSVS